MDDLSHLRKNLWNRNDEAKYADALRAFELTVMLVFPAFLARKSMTFICPECLKFSAALVKMASVISILFSLARRISKASQVEKKATTALDRTASVIRMVESHARSIFRAPVK